MSSTEPEVWYLIGLHGNAHAVAKLTATRDDGRIVREDGRDPWEPLYENGVPLWFRVSQEVADEWTADDDEDDDDWIGRP